MIGSRYDAKFDGLVKNLTVYGELEAILMAVGDFADGAAYKPIDPKHIFNLIEHYENNKLEHYNSIALDFCSKASRMYESMGDRENAGMFLKKHKKLEKTIIESRRNLCPRDALDGICAVNKTLCEDDGIDWADSVRDHADGLISGLKNHDTIHREWAAIPEVYFRLRHECNFPIKYIEETIDGIMRDDLSVSDMGIEEIKKQANHCRLDGIDPIMETTSTGVLKDAVCAFEEIGAFREASEIAGNLFYNAGLQSKYRELANYLSLPPLKSTQNM